MTLDEFPKELRHLIPNKHKGLFYVLFEIRYNQFWEKPGKNGETRVNPGPVPEDHIEDPYTFYKFLEQIN